MKITGKVVHGKKIGGHYGVATANIEVKKLPELKEGVYGVRVEYDGSEYSGVMHFGHRATFENDFVIEVHILGFEQDIYSKEITVISEKFLRETRKFDSTVELFSQIQKDILQTKKYFLRKSIFANKEWSDRASTRQGMEEEAVEKILQNNVFRDSRSIFVYAPDRFEINFVQKLCSQFPEKKFYFPKIENGEMKFYLSRYEDLKLGKFGILEPISSENLGFDPDLIFVPAVAVDKDGYRLGRGGGFYDRFLAEHTDVKTIAVMPNFAVLDSVPREAHDMRVGAILVV